MVLLFTPASIQTLPTDLAELFFGDGVDGPPPAEEKKFAELWHDKTRHESFVKHRLPFGEILPSVAEVIQEG